MEKIKVNQIIVVEGKYDAIKLDSILEGLIIPVNGFSVFTDQDKKNLLKELGKKSGIILITDSDTAGFKIRNYIQNICRDSEIIHVYIPNVKGRESRKSNPSKEGFLGVEGVSKEVLLKALTDAGVVTMEGTPCAMTGGNTPHDGAMEGAPCVVASGNTPHCTTNAGVPHPMANLTYTDLYTLNLSGTENSCANREKLCKALNVPSKLSKKAFLQVLNRMCTRKEIEDILAEKGEDKPSHTENHCCGHENILEEKSEDKSSHTENHCCGDEDILAEKGEDKPVLFWDFHGTLTIPDNQWIDGALKAYDENFSYLNISHEKIIENLSGKCLPWWTYPQRDTRHLIKDDGWWRSCEREFVNMYMACGLSQVQAETISPLIRRYVIDSQNHRLHSDVLFVLQELKSRGYKSYILSNNFPELPQLLSALNLSQFFEDTVVSGLVGYDKPRKEIFEFAKTIANRPEKCIMIGDNPTDDIKGAKACGFATILVNDRHPDYSGEDADFICKTLKDILAVLK